MQEFEEVMLYMLKKQGWEATTINSGAVGGLDAIGTRENEKLVLQAKHWKEDVGRGPLDNLMGVASREKATIAVLASSSGFTLETMLTQTQVLEERFPRLPYKLELWGNTEIKEFIDNLDDESFDQMVEPMKEKIINRLK